MRILITGADGQVGSILTKTLKHYEVIPISRKNCDLTNVNDIKKTIDHHHPNLIINTAAFTNVNKAETEHELAFKINKEAPKIIAQKSLEHDIPLIHFSTDYVFDGYKKTSYVETDDTNPLNVYGRSKLAGESEIQSVGGQYYIFRTSWIYSNIGHNFFLTIKNLSFEDKEIKIVDDQFGVPSSNIFIAKHINSIVMSLNKKNTGIYNLVPNDQCSWYQFGISIIKKINPNYDFNKIHAIKSSDYSSTISRPKMSVLDNTKIKSTFMLNFENWQTELDKVINEA